MKFVGFHFVLFSVCTDIETSFIIQFKICNAIETDLSQSGFQEFTDLASESESRSTFFTFFFFVVFHCLKEGLVKVFASVRLQG